MPSQLTITAKTGPAQQVTAQIIPNVSVVTLDLQRQLVQVYAGGTQEGAAPVKEFDLNGVTTLTDSISSGNHTLVIS